MDFASTDSIDELTVIPPNISHANLVICRATSSSLISMTMFEISTSIDAFGPPLARKLEVEDGP